LLLPFFKPLIYSRFSPIRMIDNPLISDSSSLSALTRSQFAVVRAYLQGVPLDWIAGRYMTAPGENAEALPDLRIVHRTVLSYLYTLVRIARQHDQPALADLLESGPPSSLIGTQRAVDAVNHIERLGNTAPRLTHGVALWFAPPLARRLQRAGLVRIQDIVVLANAKGASWWRTVPRVGQGAAATVIAWLLANKQSLGEQVLAGYVLPPRALAAPAQMAPVAIAPGCAQLVPWELLRISSPEIDGSSGSNRAPVERCRLAARNDYEAVNAWLTRHQENGHTWRAYRKEAERFLLWAVVEHGRAISDLAVEDCLAYLDFLGDPQPRTRWIGPMTDRWSAAWRPFQGPLSPASRKFARTVLKSLCEWLMRQRYLDFNPWDDVPASTAPNKGIQAARALPLPEWESLCRWLDNQSQRPGSAGAQARVARCAFLLLRETGMRREEACAARRLQLRHVGTPADAGGWELDVIGKGNKPRKVFPSDAAIAALRAHWMDRGLDFDDQSSNAALLSPLSQPATRRSTQKFTMEQRDGYSSAGLHNVIKTAAARYAASRPDIEQANGFDVRGVRAHALRHTFGMHAVAAGVELDVVRGILGHESLTTTTMYVEDDSARKRNQVRKMAGSLTNAAAGALPVDGSGKNESATGSQTGKPEIEG
jgi:integrase/recombinase XerC